MAYSNASSNSIAIATYISDKTDKTITFEGKSDLKQVPAGLNEFIERLQGDFDVADRIFKGLEGWS